jgi:predicted nucleotidyltransferase
MLDRSKLIAIRNYFKTKPVLKAYLFGSQARESADNQSDIDILVELDYSKRIGLEFIQMQMDLEYLLNSKVDLVSAESLSKHIAPYIDKDKKLIYAQ